MTKQKPEIIIHPGLPKTGTTFLQQEIFPKMKNVKIHQPSLTIKLDSKKINLISNEELSTGATIKGIAKESSLHQYREERNTVAKRLKSLFPNAKILLITREQEEWKKSLYSENIKHGAIQTYTEWQKTLQKYDPHVFDIKSYTDTLQSLFEEILILDYTELKTDNKNFVKKICDFIGTPEVEYHNKKRKQKLPQNAQKRWHHYNIYANKIFKSKYAETGFFPRKLNPSEIYRWLYYR